jgi:Serine carboxypeptidase S28
MRLLASLRTNSSRHSEVVETNHTYTADDLSSISDSSSDHSSLSSNSNSNIMTLSSYQKVPEVHNEFEEPQEDAVSEFHSDPSSFPRTAKIVLVGLAVLAFMAVSFSTNNSSSSTSNGFDKERLQIQLWGSSRHEKKNKVTKHHVKRSVHDKKRKEKKHEGEDEEVKVLAEYQIPRYFNDQLVDHFAPDTTTWSNRYYISSEYFKGPGHPLIVVMGGEGPVDEVFYPFVKDTLAEKFGAFVLQTEHRFYGTSVPTEAGASALPTSAEFRQLLTPDQALEDFVRVIRHIQAEIGCSADRTSPEYCPVISVGASYPGFLSAMMRFVYPEVVDMSYASSAPLLLYAQARGTEVYFDYVTQVAETASPGCAHAYKSTLANVKDAISNMSIHRAAKELGICNNIPEYINTPELFAQEVTMMVGFSNADFNMDYHPPGYKGTDVIKGCLAFQQTDKTPMERMADWLVVKAESGATDHPGEPCYDLHWDIPTGKFAKITGADWSGMGDGDTATTWEFQCCSDLIIETGFGPKSMFLERPFDLDWLTGHCQARFQVTPTPTRMVDKWHFDQLVEHGASHILFTNGLQDGWSPLSYTENLTDTIVALNFPSGAHHSDLNEWEPEWEDIVQGRKDVAQILGEWIAELKQKVQ